ncbi:MAG: hypothetical protein EPN84_04545 [Legionella sp.]|nr:MAG: hypothetical protein EPN84_04545 [Legionella sp.]
MDVKQFIKILSQSLNTDDLFANDELLDLITHRGNYGRTVGQEIAWKYDEQTLSNFFAEVVCYELETLPEVLECVDDSGRSIGHYIAEFKGFAACKAFFELILQHAPNSLIRVLEALMMDGWSIVHLVARFQDSNTMNYLLDLIHQEAPHLLPKLLKLQVELGWNLGILVARYQKPQSVIHFLEKVLAVAPDSLRYTLKDGRHIGHLLLEFQNEKVARFYFEKVLPKLPVEVQIELVTAASNTGWNMGLMLAHQYSGKLLIHYFDLIVKLGLVTKLIKETTIDKRHLGHYIAQYKTFDELKLFVELIQQHCPHLLSELLTSTMTNGCHMGHTITFHQNLPALKFYLNTLIACDKSQVAKVVTAKVNNQVNMAHYIAEKMNQEALQYFFKFIIDNCPEVLSEVLQQTNATNDNVIDLIMQYQPQSIGAIAFQLIKANKPLGAPVYKQLKTHRMAVLDYISGLPATEQLQLIDQIKDTKTPLGMYFNLKTDLIHKHFGSNNELLTKLKEMKRVATIQNIPSPFGTNKLVNLEDWKDSSCHFERI